MGLFFLLFCIIFQVALAIITPSLLVYVSLLTGAIPLNFGHNEVLAGAVGRLDPSAIRLFGLWLAVFLVILMHIRGIGAYFVFFRFHLLFLCFCILSLFWASDIIYGARMIAKLTSPLFFLLLTLLVISSMKQLEIMERLMITSGVLITALAVVTWLTRMDLNQKLTIPGTSRALFSAHLLAISMLSLANFTSRRRSKEFFLVILFAVAIVAAFTRITIAGLFIGSSVILFMAYRGLPRVALPISCLIGLPALFLFNDAFKSRMFFGANKITLSSIVDSPSIALEHLHGSGRFAAWNNVLDRFFEPSPLIGSGIGATQNYFYSHSVTGLGVIHSEYIRLLSEVGIFGLILFIATAATYLTRLVQTYRRTPDSFTGRYALAAAGGLIVYLIFMATDNAFDYFNGFGMYVFALIAMSEKARELEATKSIAKVPPGFENKFESISIKLGEQKARRYQIIYRP